MPGLEIPAVPIFFPGKILEVCLKNQGFPDGACFYLGVGLTLVKAGFRRRRMLSLNENPLAWEQYGAGFIIEYVP